MTTVLGKFQFNSDQFQNHMKTKATYWGPLSVAIANDFAVFTFDMKFQCDNAFDGASCWANDYNYSVERDGVDRLLVINKTVDE